MYRVITFGILLVIWVVLSGLFDPFHFTLGLLSAAFLTLISSDLFFTDRSKKLTARARELIRLPGYLGWLLYQIILANIHLLKLAMFPGGLQAVEPRVVSFRSRLQSDFAKYVLANSITLTPGTVTIKVEGDQFHVHAISRFAADSLDGAMEERVGAVFEGEKE